MSQATLGDLLRYLRTACDEQLAEDLTDRQLLERFLVQREEAAFTVLVQRHGPMVLAVCRRLLGDCHSAEDCFQATFLVLVRRAASIRKKGSVGSWLHSVALHIASKARAQTAARRHRERQAGHMPRTLPLDELTWQELRSVLDEEIGRLPEKYRAAIVLCYFEGKSYDQAARDLGCPKSSLAKRLARARELLHGQLTKRGITLAAGALAVALGEKATGTPVTALLTINTVRAAASIAVGKTAAGGCVSPRVVTLMEEAMPGMLGIKGKLVLMLVALALAVGGAGLAAHGGLAEQSLPTKAEEVPTAPTPTAAGGPLKKDAAVGTDLFGDPLPAGAVARLGTVRFRHGIHTQEIAFAPNGKVLASTGGGGFGVCLWDAASGRPLHQLPVPLLSFSVAFSPDSKLLVADAFLSVIDVATGKELRRLDNPNNQGFTPVVFSPDGRTVAGGTALSRFGTAVLWDAATGKELRRLKGHDGSVNSLAFSPGDGKFLVTGSSDKTVRLWEVATGKELRRFLGSEKTVYSVAFSPDGKIVAAGGEDQTVRLWDTDTGKLLHHLKGQGVDLQRVVFAPVGKLLASVGFAGTICLWDPDTGKEIRRWETGGDSRLAFSPNGRVLASGGRSAIRLWDAATGKEINPVGVHTGTVESLVVTPDGKGLLSCARDRKVVRWDLASGQGQCLSSGGLGEATGAPLWQAFDLSPDGKVLAHTMYLLSEQKWDPRIHLWDTATGKKIRELQGPSLEVHRLRFSPDGKILASAGRDGILLWDVATGGPLEVLKGTRRQITSYLPLAFSPDGRWLAFVDLDRNIRLLEAATGKELRRWDSMQDNTNALVFSPDGTSLVSISRAGIQVWATATGKPLARFGGLSAIMPSQPVAFSPSGRFLAVADLVYQSLPSGDRVSTCTMHLLEVISGEEIRSFNVPQGSVWSLAFTPDGRSLASGGGDSTILLWDLTGRAKDGKVKAAGLTAAELDGLWADLAGAAPKADTALWALALAPKQSMPFLKERMRPIPAAPPEQVAKLIADLDNKNFSMRDKAVRMLEALGEAADTALRKALESNTTLEVRQRLEQLLQKRGKDIIRQLRAIDALEQIGTAEARPVLEALAKGATNPQVAQAAVAALRRLAKRSSTTP
jgi:RNA polymerase sigma factor (sigma-70 family)